MINKNIPSSDVVKYGKPQIWSLNHLVILAIFDACYADNIRHQGYRPTV